MKKLLLAIFAILFTASIATANCGSCGLDGDEAAVPCAECALGNVDHEHDEELAAEGEEMLEEGEELADEAAEEAENVLGMLKK